MITKDEIQVDTAIYKERDDDYAIVANHVLMLGDQPVRPYFNKPNHKILTESFDPIRIKLRVIPASRAPEPKGMNADFYFRKAAKKCLQSDLPHAIDLLKRGLQVSPTHYLCRFNHGVVLFKFGLIYEAAQEFWSLTEIHPKEAWPFYNFAICLIQLGQPVRQAPKTKRERKEPTDVLQLSANKRYEKAIDFCNKAIELSRQSDKQLAIDAYFL